MIKHEIVMMSRVVYGSGEIFNFVLDNDYGKIETESRYDCFITEFREKSGINLNHYYFTERPDEERFNVDRSGTLRYPNYHRFRVEDELGGFIDIDLIYAIKINDRFFELSDIKYIDNI